MAKNPTQSFSDQARALAGKWTKTEKRSEISRQIAAAKASTYKKLKAFKQGLL
jgi:hypothetical protein